MSSASDIDNDDSLVEHYFSNVYKATVFAMDNFEQLCQANVIIFSCFKQGISTNSRLMTSAAVAMFLQLLVLYSLDSYSGGSAEGKRANFQRNREAAYRQLLEDYFSAQPNYPVAKFRLRFRMQPGLFNRVVEGVLQVDEYFQQKEDALKNLGAHPIQKVTAALRMLAYGASADQLDDWIRLGESTILQTLKRFVSAVIKAFGEEYLRAPNKDDVFRLMKYNASRGFPGCLGSLDCWLWKWKNCPMAWKGHYTGRKGTGCITEACCSHDLWIWHLFVGNPGSLNDLNVLDRSPLLQQLYYGTMPKVKFSINGNEYDNPYWLVDGIYPRRSSFVSAFSKPISDIDRNFTHWQESCRKDIERAFGVLQARWRILSFPARHWDRYFLDDIVRCCVILHNMIVEDEYQESEQADEDVEFDEFDGTIVSPNYRIEVEDSMVDPAQSLFAEVLARVREDRDEENHFKLRDDLKHHLYEKHTHYRKHYI